MRGAAVNTVVFKSLSGLVPRWPHQLAYSSKQLANDLACRFDASNAHQEQGVWMAIHLMSESIHAGPGAGWFHEPNRLRSDDADLQRVIIWVFADNAEQQVWVISRNSSTWLVIDVVAQTYVLLPTGETLEDALDELAKPFGVPHVYAPRREVPLVVPVPVPVKVEPVPAHVPLVPPAGGPEACVAAAGEEVPMLVTASLNVAAAAKQQQPSSSGKSSKKRLKKAVALVAPPPSPLANAKE